MRGIEFPLTYSISNLMAINLIAHHDILDVVTLGNCFLGLNIDSNSQGSDFNMNFYLKFIFITFLQYKAEGGLRKGLSHCLS